MFHILGLEPWSSCGLYFMERTKNVILIYASCIVVILWLCKWTICKSLLKMDKPKRIRAQGNSGHCTKQMSKRWYFKKRRNLNKKKKKWLQDL